MVGTMLLYGLDIFSLSWHHKLRGLFTPKLKILTIDSKPLSNKTNKWICCVHGYCSWTNPCYKSVCSQDLGMGVIEKHTPQGIRITGEKKTKQEYFEEKETLVTTGSNDLHSLFYHFRHNKGSCVTFTTPKTLTESQMHRLSPWKMSSHFSKFVDFCIRVFLCSCFLAAVWVHYSVNLSGLP